jgi:SH3-like domain-containing protein
VLKKSALLVILGLLVSSNAWAEMMSVRVNTANFRERPSTNADVLFTADKYYPVEVLDRKRGWAKVKDFEGEVAWVAERLLRRKPTVIVRVERANVRAAPRQSARVLFKGTWSESYPVREMKGPWVLIQTPDGEEGWIHRSIVWGDDGWDHGSEKD